jgi:aerobic C4-dicarboxylate transport protein
MRELPLESQRGSILRSLYLQVLIAVAIGIALGYFAPDLGVKMKPLADGFIKLIKMLIGPVIFCTVVNGIAGMQNLKAVGKTGLLALLYFEALSTVALILGLVVVNVVRPGAGMNVDVSKLDPHEIESYTQAAQHQSVGEFLLNIIPNTLVDAFAKGEILQVLLVAVLFGFALHGLGDRGESVRAFVDKLGKVLFRIVGILMHLAPIGAFGAMAATVGKYGAISLLSLGKLMVCFYATCLVFVLVVLGAVARYCGFSILKFVRFLRDELLIVLGTSSSESVLPRMITKLEQAGCAKSVVGLVIPTGYSFNLDGTSIYLTMAAVFIAQATNTPLTLTHQITLLAILLLTSKGAAAVTGSGFIVLAATLSALGTLPPTALALIFGIDRFMSEARALTNLVGNGVATVVVSKWCNALDKRRLDAALDAGSEVGR